MMNYFFKLLITALGKNGEASPPFLIISLTIVDATEVYLGSPVKKIVSIFLSKVLFASAIVFSLPLSFFDFLVFS